MSGEELEEVFKRGIYEKPEKHHLEDGKSVIIGANDKSVVSEIMVVKWLVKNLYSP